MTISVSARARAEEEERSEMASGDLGKNDCGRRCPYCDEDFDDLSPAGFDNHRKYCFLKHLPGPSRTSQEKSGNSGDTLSQKIRGCELVQFVGAGDNLGVLSASASKRPRFFAKPHGEIALG